MLFSSLLLAAILCSGALSRTLSVEPIERVCPPGVVTSSDRSKCFFIVPVPTTFEDAHKTCSNLKLRVASIESEADNNWLTETAYDRFTDLGLDRTVFWLGASVSASSGTWKWLDGSPFSFSNWADSHAGPGNCLFVDSASGLWHTGNCTERASYVCEGDVPKPTPPPTTAPPPTCPSCSECPDPVTTTCPPSPEPSWKQLGNNLYCSNPTAMSWGDARKWCASHGADLVSIHSEQENLFVYGMWSYGTWLGGHSPSRNNTFVWADGTEWDFQNWSQNDPNNQFFGDANCLQAFIKNQWTSSSCSDANPFVCKKVIV
uniref:C-type lectin domain-containing protein n=1 Tax=Steinernema glaseri TaxID=37863 RepID=A0A1I8AIP5_9BILA